MISDGVLMANVARDALANGYHLAVLAGEEGFAASYPGEAAQHVRIAVGIRFIEDADGVYQGGGSPGHFQDVGQGVRAGVIAAVANDDQYFLFRAAGLQPVARLEDRVVERRHAPGGCVGDGAPEVLGAIAEREVDNAIVVLPGEELQVAISGRTYHGSQSLLPLIHTHPALETSFTLRGNALRDLEFVLSDGISSLSPIDGDSIIRFEKPTLSMAGTTFRLE